MLFYFVVFFFFTLFRSHALLTVSEDYNYFKTSTWGSIETSLNFGEIKGYYSFADLNKILDTYQTNFPQIIANTVTLGTTSQGKSILAIQVTYDENNVAGTSAISLSDFQNQFPTRPAILLTGMFEGSDPNSMYMTIYTLKRLIYGYVHEDPAFLNLLKTRQVWIVPMLNVDTYQTLSDKLIANETVPDQLSIKNERVFGCAYPNDGTYLRLNYPQSDDAPFNRRDKCDMLYEGPGPLSEQETASLNILASKVTFTIALSFFSQRDAVLLPLHWLQNGDYKNPANYKREQDYAIFQELYDNAHLNTSTFFGNLYAKEQTYYQGEVSDYLYSKKAIYALSVEIRKSDIKKKDTFLDPQQRLNVLRYYFPVTMYSIFKISTTYKWSQIYQVTESCLEQHEKTIDCQTTNALVYSSKFSITNEGLVSASQVTLIITTHQTLDLKIIGTATSYEVPYNFKDTLSVPAEVTKYTVSDQFFFKITLPTLGKRSTMIISLTGLYSPSPNVPIGNEYITLAVENGYSFENRHVISVPMSNFGSVEGYKKKIKDDNNYINKRTPSIILIAVYFTVIGIAILISVGLGLASHYQEKRKAK